MTTSDETCRQCETGDEQPVCVPSAESVNHLPADEGAGDAQSTIWQSSIRAAFASENFEFFEFMRWVHARRVRAKVDSLFGELVRKAYDVPKTVGN